MTLLKGTQRADLLTGTSRADTAVGRPGSDQISGLDGRDTLSGGDGRDVIRGGAGNDVIYGHGRSDEVAGSGDIIATRVATGLAQPVFATSAPGRPDKLFVVEKEGTIKILDPATGATSDFLEIPAGELLTGGEQGLLGLAFHPDYATNRQFYVYLVNADGNIEVREYKRSIGDQNVANPNSGDLILTIAHPVETNHNGGWMGFGKDGFLYISVGDGGGSGDANGNSQNKNVLLGKMLRIDVDGDDFKSDSKDYAIPDDNPFADANGADEIWAYGLRNAWRPSFDRLTGDLYIADVGQAKREEINFQPGTSDGGENYGWNIREGKIPFEGGPTAGLTDPLIDYRHDSSGGESVTGGYVYRGQAAGMQGVYLYADFISDRIWSFRVVDGKAVDAAERTDQFKASGGSIDAIASFGEDGRGNLYIVGIDGEIFKLAPRKGAGDGADALYGGAGRDRILGGVGDDTLNGNTEDDTLLGGDQDDILNGGRGRDVLFGGEGADVFDFDGIRASGRGERRDVIRDFDADEDRLDFSTIDARDGEAGNQKFSFIGGNDFSGRGQIRAEQDGTSVILLLNTGGTFAADMQIILRGVDVADLQSGDFIL